MPTKVIELGEVRDLLETWGQVRDFIRTGRVRGFALMLEDQAGNEAIFMGGAMRTDAQAGARAGMLVSMEAMRRSQPSAQDCSSQDAPESRSA